MATRKIELVNRLGLHARAAAKLVHVASRYRCHVAVRHNEEEVNGKSILGLLLLAAPCGSSLELVAEGEDEREALDALEELVKDRFGEAE